MAYYLPPWTRPRIPRIDRHSQRRIVPILGSTYAQVSLGPSVSRLPYYYWSKYYNMM